MNTSPTTLIVGVGNALRQDDGAGPAVIQCLQPQLPKTVTVTQLDGDAADLMALWQGVDRVILVDATRSGTAPGTIQRFLAHATPLPRTAFFYSSHLLGVAEAVEMARVLGRLPARLIIYGIEGAAFGYGEELSPSVAEAVQKAAHAILAEVTADNPGLPV